MFHLPSGSKYRYASTTRVPGYSSPIQLHIAVVPSPSYISQNVTQNELLRKEMCVYNRIILIFNNLLHFIFPSLLKPQKIKSKQKGMVICPLYTPLIGQKLKRRAPF